MVSPYFWSKFRMTERWEITVGEIEEGVNCKFFRNDFQVYRFTAPDMILAMLELPEKVRKLSQFPVRINNRKDVNDNVLGREIYYREMTAIVADFDGENGRVLMRAPYPRGFLSEPWVDGSKSWNQDIWEDLLSPHIHWHREE